jgi:hypothetical protein
MIMSLHARRSCRGLAGGHAAAGRPGADEALGDNAFSVPASIARACCCWWGGKKSTMRLTVSGASTVWSVENTRWPVSAADSAVLTGLLIAHLADEDHVRVLTQHAPQRALEGDGVAADLALVDDRQLVAVEELDRVLDRHHMLGLRSG